MQDKLNIGEGFDLPDELVTQTIAILAKRGSGKTYTAMVMSEEIIEKGHQIVIVDPVGVCWGLRASADGESAGLAILIAGGEHGDVPIDSGSGEALAEMIVKERMSVIIDLSLLRKGEQVRFMTDFAEALYHLKSPSKYRTAMHLMLDEADSFAPQKPMPDQLRLLGAIEDIVRRGRSRGIGVTMITQRPSVLNKNVLTQIEVLVALRLTAPLDQKAVDEWIRTHAEEGQREEFMSSLPSLPIGTAWFWSPGWLNLFQKVKVRARRTLDSSSTPKVGEIIKEARAFADVDLEKIKDALKSSEEEIKSNDPKLLKKKIHELQVQLNQQPQPKVEIKIEKVPVLPEELMALGPNKLSAMAGILEQSASLIQNVADIMAGNRVTTFENEFTNDFPPEAYKPSKPIQIQKPIQSSSGLDKAQKSVLGVLAQYPQGRTKSQLGILAGYSPKSGHFSNVLSSLRTREFIEGVGTLVITKKGETELGDFEVLPKGEELRQYWYGKLSKAERSILEVLVKHYPVFMSKEKIGEEAGYSHTSGHFSNSMSKLRTLELIDGVGNIRASDTLMS